MGEVEYSAPSAGGFAFVETLHHDNQSANDTIFLPGGEAVNGSMDNGTTHMISRFTGDPAGYAVPVIFALIFFVGIVGNGTLIFTVSKNKAMRNTPNIFIVSLALGDLILILVSVPFTATIYTFTEWPYGESMCKLNEFLQSLSLGVSVFTLTALSGDRYTAIVDPMSKHKGNPLLRTLLIACCIWGLAILLAIPELVAAHIVHKNYEGIVLELCESHPQSWGSWYPQFHVMFRFVIYFALPMVIIGVFYILMARILIQTTKNMPGEGKSGQGQKQMEARKKVAKVVLSFVLVFIVCWLPRHIYTLWYYYDPGLYNMFWHIFKIIGFCLCFINSCINPLTLYFLSKQFRHYYNKYLFCCCPGGCCGHFDGERNQPRYNGIGYNMDTTTHGGTTHTHAYTTVRHTSTTMTMLPSNIVNCDSKL